MNPPKNEQQSGTKHNICILSPSFCDNKLCPFLSLSFSLFFVVDAIADRGDLACEGGTSSAPSIVALPVSLCSSFRFLAVLPVHSQKYISKKFGRK